MIDIDSLIKQARSSGNKTELKAYQNLKAEFENFKYAQKLPRKINEEIQLRLIAGYNKKLEDAVKQFSQARRDDLVAEYTSEWEVLKKLLPEPVNGSQIYSELCKWQIKMAFENDWKVDLDKPIIPKKEMGTVIKYLKSKFPTADGKMISEIVKKYVI